jgi:hypothetical protein
MPIIKKIYKLEVVGGSTLLDFKDYEHFKRWKWFKHRTGYIQRAKKINGRWKTIRLHVEILKPQKGMQTDHINRDRSDNRRCNLREVTASQNAHNRKVRLDNKSGFTGVRFREDSKKWSAILVIERKRNYLGCFINKVDAINAYEKAKENYVRSQGL